MDIGLYGYFTKQREWLVAPVNNPKKTYRLGKFGIGFPNADRQLFQRALGNLTVGRVMRVKNPCDLLNGEIFLATGGFVVDWEQFQLFREDFMSNGLCMRANAKVI